MEESIGENEMTTQENSRCLAEIYDEIPEMTDKIGTISFLSFSDKMAMSRRSKQRLIFRKSRRTVLRRLLCIRHDVAIGV